MFAGSEGVAKAHKEMRDPGNFMFAEGTPKHARAQAVADYINPLIEGFYEGTFNVGVESFQYPLLEVVNKAVLLEEMQWIDPNKVGVVPENREGALALSRQTFTISCRSWQTTE